MNGFPKLFLDLMYVASTLAYLIAFFILNFQVGNDREHWR